MSDMQNGSIIKRRLVTLFADIAGSTRMVIHNEPEQVLGAFQCFSELVSDIALSHRGHVKDFEGDGVMLYFDSAVDAAEAALAIRAALDRNRCDSGCGEGPGVPARLALTVGDVAVGMVGPALHRAVALVGLSINLGARLLKAVPPGNVAASTELVAALEHEAPSLARRFTLFDPAYEVPGAGGLTIAVHALAGDRPSHDPTIVSRRPGWAPNDALVSYVHSTERWGESATSALTTTTNGLSRPGAAARALQSPRMRSCTTTKHGNSAG